MNWLHIVIGLLLLPLAVKIAQAVLPIVRERCGGAVLGLSALVESTFRWAGDRILDDGRLTPTESISQSLGSIMLMGAGVVFALSEVMFAILTILPLLGIPIKLPVWAAELHPLIGFSIVLLAVVYGCALTDLIGWTFVSRFALIETCRVWAFLTAGLGCLGSLGVAVALAMFRGVALSETSQGEMWMMNLPMVILIALAVLLFVGGVFAIMSGETFLRTVTALLLCMVGTVLWMLKMALSGLDMAAEVTLAMLRVVMPGRREGTGSFQTGAQRVMQGIASFGRTVGGKVSVLVERKKQHAGGAGDEESWRHDSDLRADFVVPPEQATPNHRTQP